jgi:alanyl-tRNA synthetase
MFKKINQLGAIPAPDVGSKSDDQTTFSVADIRKSFLDFFASKGHTVVASSPLVPWQRPDADVHQLRHGAVQGRVPRRGQAPLRARRLGAGLPPRRRQAQRPGERGLHGAPPHLLRDAGQLELRRLLQARVAEVGLGTADAGLQAAAERLLATVYHEDDEAYDIWTKESACRPSA